MNSSESISPQLAGIDDEPYYHAGGDEVALFEAAHRRKLPVRMLSQGQRRRVALARLALEEKPGFWVLDEPFDALDDAGLALVQELFIENARRGGTVLFTSHIRVQPEGLPLVELMLQGTRAA